MEKNNNRLICAALVFGVILLCGNAKAQELNVDSLVLTLENPKLTATQKIVLCEKLCREYSTSDPGKSIRYGELGVGLSKKEKGKPHLGSLYHDLGMTYCYKSDYAASKAYFDRSLDVALKTGDRDLESTVYHAYGTMYGRCGPLSESLAYDQKALRMAEELGNKSQIASIVSNIVVIYGEMLDRDRQVAYYIRALKLYREIDDKAGIAHVAANLGTTYTQIKEFDKARELIGEAIELNRQLGNKTKEAFCLAYLANIYQQSGELDKALDFAGQSLAVAKQTGNENEMAEALKRLSYVYYAMKDYTASEVYAVQAIDMTDTVDYTQRSIIFQNLLKINIQKGDKEQTLFYLSWFVDALLRRSGEQGKEMVAGMAAKYETEKKELKISALEKEKELYRWLGFAGGAIVLLLVAFLIVRQRMVRQKMARLEQEKQLAATQSVLDGETAERTRLARDLHDGLGGMLSVVKLNLSNMKQGVILENEDISRFDAALKMLDDSIGELRRVAHNMMPESLSLYGLKAALADFCNSVVGSEFHYFGSGDRLDPKLEVMIYRTVHELVNNVLKHAGATKIIIQVVQETNRIAITVQDDGCGFDINTPTNGTGLNNIRNRVGSYNGQMEIFSKLGEGTEVSVYFKLPE